MPSLFSSIVPADLNLPTRFTEFREAQGQAIDYVLYETDDKKKFTALGLPTGSGKSLLGMAIARVTDLKAVYTTATKGLEDQICKDFEESGVKDVRGKNNYTCATYTKTGKKHTRACDEGAKEECHLASTTGCPYFSALEAVRDSRIGSTNYSYLLHSRKYNPNALGNDLEPVGLLVLDECHAILKEVCNFLAIDLSSDDLVEWDGHDSATVLSGLMPDTTWTEYARRAAKEAKQIQKALESQYARSADAHEDPIWEQQQEIVDKCKLIASMDKNWVWERDRETGSVHFEPIWPAQYMSSLWGGVEKVVLISATLRPYTLELLGLKKEQYNFREWPAVFPAQLGPVYHIPTVKLSWKSTDEDYEKLISRVDEIVGARQDRKGIIHCVSYDRMRRVLDRSRFKNQFFCNDNSRGAVRTADDFRRADAPACLVSPSFSTGYDFPGDQAEYQIILKMPFPNERSRVQKERCKSPDYRMYCAVQELVQMCGRARRYPTDRCETFVIDNAISWALGPAGKKFAPVWFRVNTVKEVPKRPVKL